MRSRKALKLRKDRDLKSNNLEAIRNEFRLLYEELDSQWRLIHQDVSTIQVPDGEWIYFGGVNAVSSIRIGKSGTSDFVAQHFIAGTYVERLKSSP